MFTEPLPRNGSTRCNIASQRRIRSLARKQHKAGSRACRLFHDLLLFRLLLEAKFFFRNVCWLSTDYTELHPRRHRDPMKYAFLGTTQMLTSCPQWQFPQKEVSGGGAAALHTLNRISRHTAEGLFVFKHCNCIHASKTGILFLLLGMKERVSSRQRHFRSDEKTDRQTDRHAVGTLRLVTLHM
jgi:hypothetical protein